MRECEVKLLTNTHGHIHDLADLLSVSLTQRSTKDSEILGKHKHLNIEGKQPIILHPKVTNLSAVNQTVASDHTIAIVLFLLHAKLIAAVSFQHVILSKRILVQQQRDSLSGRQLSSSVLGVDSLLSTAQLCTLLGIIQSLSENSLQRYNTGRLGLSRE